MSARARRAVCAFMLLACLLAFVAPVGVAKAETEDAIRYFATSDATLSVWRDADKKRGVSCKLKPNTPIYVIELGAEWTKIFTDDGVGYVASAALKDVREHQMGVPDDVMEGKDASLLLAEYQDCFDGDVAPAVSRVKVRNADGPYVPISPRADDDAFAGALLLGDSQASGLLRNQIIPALEIKPVIGLHIQDIEKNKRAVTERGHGKMSVTDYLLYKAPKTVYIWLAQNDIKDYYAVDVLRYYDLALNRLIEAMPDTLFYLFEMVPLHRYKEGSRTALTTENVRAFNEGLYALAKRHNVFVLQINDVLSDKNGEMPSILVSNDNFHLSRLGHRLIADYLRTHTLEVEP